MWDFDLTVALSATLNEFQNCFTVKGLKSENKFEVVDNQINQTYCEVPLSRLLSHLSYLLQKQRFSLFQKRLLSLHIENLFMLVAQKNNA